MPNPGLKSEALVYAPRLSTNHYDASIWRIRQRHERRKRYDARPGGFWNCGQSCHVGAAMVALAACPSVRLWLAKQRVDGESSAGIVVKYVLQVAQAGSVDPRPVLRVLECGNWKSRHAQDAHETLGRIMEVVEHLFVPKAKAWGKGPFVTVSSSAMQCMGCRKRGGMRFQANLMLTLPIGKGGVAELIMREYSGREIVEGRCEGCGKWGKHVRAGAIWRWAEVLVVQLQLIGYGVGRGEGGTVTKRLIMPWRRGYVEYQLRSVIRHWGTAGTYSSHFDAIVGKESHGAREGLAGIAEVSRWWHVDDDRVAECAASNACHNAYLAVYDRRQFLSGKG